MARKIGPLCLVPILALAGCNVSQPDYTPFGDGMKAIGICLVVCAVVRALAELVISEIKSGDDKQKPRHRQDKSKGGEP